MVEYHGKPESKRGYQNEHGENHPEPRPVFLLSCVLPHGDSLEEIRTEPREEFADTIGKVGTPNVRGGS